MFWPALSFPKSFLAFLALLALFFVSIGRWAALVSFELAGLLMTWCETSDPLGFGVSVIMLLFILMVMLSHENRLKSDKAKKSSLQNTFHYFLEIVYKNKTHYHIKSLQNNQTTNNINKNSISLLYCTWNTWFFHLTYHDLKLTNKIPKLSS